ncbi:sensor histidine kinase [Chrysiogenes arsenatis]|uniref:sensor histidine kinase n=1 Tax=Chrysiogenes arsenatis TaxID=309797 RepID=UPI0004215E2D|nr:ATP-binding protein [Chrysiogenes arsenatis]
MSSNSLARLQHLERWMSIFFTLLAAVWSSLVIIMVLKRQLDTNLLGYGSLWVVGILVLWFSWWRASKRLSTEQIINERETLILQLNRANAELQRFAEISAHHLQEPTRRIAAYTKRLRQHMHGTTLDDETTLTITYIEEGAEQLRAIVRDIQLYLAASEPRGEIQPLDLCQLVNKIQHEKSHLLSACNATITCHSTIPLFLDAGRAKDIFSILIDNAVRYQRENIPPIISIRSYQEKTALRIEVSDNGRGIPQEYHQRVLRVFEKLQHADREGTGVGLAIVRRIVESCGGRIWLDSQHAHGITVYLELPNRKPK